MTTRQTGLIQFGDVDLDLAAVEQLAEKSQARAVADALNALRARCAQPAHRGQALAQLLAGLDADMDAQVCVCLNWPCRGVAEQNWQISTCWRRVLKGHWHRQCFLAHACVSIARGMCTRGARRVWHGRLRVFSLSACEAERKVLLLAGAGRAGAEPAGGQSGAAAQLRDRGRPEQAAHAEDEAAVRPAVPLLFKVI